MRKTFKKIAMLATATVAIGVASLTSCTKEEESLTNNVPAMELKVQAEPPGNGGGGGGTTITSDAIIMYWHLKKDWDSLGNSYYIKYCAEGRTNLGVCLIIVKRPSSDLEYGTYLLSRIDGNGVLKSLEISTANMSAEEKEDFANLAGEGVITFEENLPISDPELLAVVNVDHIPAGTYPVRMEDENFIITISE